MIKKSSWILLICLIGFVASGYIKPNVYEIDAGKNATLHNNLGLKEISEGNYYAAIQEFSLAIALNPNTQATAIYYNNLGEAYMKVGYFKDAQRCFENAITQYTLNFLYYQNLVSSIKAQNIIPSMIEKYQKKSEQNSLYMITLGLLYVENGDKRRGIIKLDEFCMKEPRLIVTGAVRNYLKQLARD